MATGEKPNLVFSPLTPERRHDFERLFGPRGACGGCWCMWWRLPRKEFEQRKGQGNRLAMKALIDSGVVPGILAFLDGVPVGWCSVGPREDFPALQRSRVAKPVDDQPVWSIVCLFVDKHHRRCGVSVELIKAAVEYAGSGGAQIVEAYAVDPRKPGIPDLYAYHGLLSAFLQAGFEEVARHSQSRPVVRRYLK